MHIRSFAILKIDLQERNGFKNNNYSLDMDYLNKSETTFKNYEKEKEEGANMLIIRTNIVYNHRIILSFELPGN